MTINLENLERLNQFKKSYKPVKSFSSNMLVFQS